MQRRLGNTVLTELDRLTAGLLRALGVSIRFLNLQEKWDRPQLLRLLPSVRTMLPCPLLCDFVLPPTRLGGIYFQFPLIMSNVAM